jgi:hypothetical protein
LALDGLLQATGIIFMARALFNPMKRYVRAETPSINVAPGPVGHGYGFNIQGGLL